MSRSVLRQFFLATALIVLYATLTSMRYMTARPHFAERSGGVARTLLLQIPGEIIFALPVAAAVALAVLRLAPGAFRQSILLVGTVTALLVVNDLAARPLWTALDRELMGTDTGTSVRSGRFDDATSALGGSLAHLLGKVQVEDIQRWPPDTAGRSGFRPITDPRVIVRMSAFAKYADASRLLFLPFLASGLVLGLGVWLRRVATFRSERDERLFRLVLGWVLAIAGVLGTHVVQRGMAYELSSPESSLLWILAPVIVLGIPSALGWRAVRRLDRLGDA